MNFLKKHFDRLKWDLTPGWKKREQLKNVKTVLAAIPEGKALLDMAKAEGVRIRFSTGLIHSPSLGQFLSGTKKITLDPREPLEVQVATLAHELRHMWQDKTLGIKTHREATADIKTALLIRRIKEADAFAFDAYVQRKIEVTPEYLDRMIALSQDALEKSGTKKLSDAQKREIAANMAESIQAQFNAPACKEERERDFLEKLETLASYDGGVIKSYHSFYTHPIQGMPHKAAAAPFDVSAMRKILHMDCNPDSPAYLDSLSDEDFVDAVLKPVSTTVLKTSELMDAFEKARRAPGGLTTAESLALRLEIHREVKKVKAGL